MLVLVDQDRPQDRVVSKRDRTEKVETVVVRAHKLLVTKHKVIVAMVLSILIMSVSYTHLTLPTICSV